MGVLNRGSVARLAAALALAVAVGLALGAGPVACGSGNRFDVSGIVEDVDVENGQVLISHEEIPRLMAAMTMNFAVRDPAVLARMRGGQKIDFVLEANRDGYFVIDFEVTGEVEAADGWLRLGDVLVRTDPAPPFALVDQRGEAFASSSLAGKAVLLDFVFTQCRGPCPILTSKHVAVQRALSAETQAGTHFVSISLDPAYDTPERLQRYALAHGADLENWSFLTGPSDAARGVAMSFGVGSSRLADGDIEHVVATFLIAMNDGDPRIVRRYLGLEASASEIADELSALVATP